ncbi:hypothetical protein GOP47_0013383 [Adiantum capillus-veneris]|uniref:Uncharacterized protein n=1 Tax=Adiantum capillus-veneris TaxID=13818 RepID=A0A9D4UNY1_ADICA|nr:hypothetical protein GOP47_0013383 [Adiantum capillus-veneris]
MAAPNTQLSPLQHHSKTSSTITSSFKSYSRIQSEVEREGFEVHKENVLALPCSRKNKPSATGEQFGSLQSESSAPSFTLQTGPSHTPRKTVLQSLLPSKSGAMLHGHVAQPLEQEAVRMKLTTSCEKTCLFGSGISEHQSIRAPSSSMSALLPPNMDKETRNAYKLCSEMFPQAYIPMSACLVTTSFHQTHEYNLSPCAMLEPTSHSIVGSIEVDAGDEAGNIKRLKYTSIGEDGTSMKSIGIQHSEQGFTSCCVIDGSRTRAAHETANSVCINDVGAFDWEAKSQGGHAVTSCGTSITAESSEAPSAIGLKLFATSVHVQMPKALSTFSEGGPSVPLTLEHCQQQAGSRIQKTPLFSDSYADADWGKFLALSATPIANDIATTNAKVLPFQQRFKQLQAFLKQCDEADQNGCLHALRSLPAAARSGHAVELETRAIRLSLEEGKEMKRMRLLNLNSTLRPPTLTPPTNIRGWKTALGSIHDGQLCQFLL